MTRHFLQQLRMCFVRWSVEVGATFYATTNNVIYRVTESLQRKQILKKTKSQMSEPRDRREPREDNERHESESHDLEKNSSVGNLVGAFHMLLKVSDTETLR